MNQTLTHIKYGSIDLMTKFPFNTPTKQIFENWKKDFLQLEDVKFFDVYLTGGFAEKLTDDSIETYDVDIVLTGCNDNKKIEKLVYEGTKLGFEKYNTFFDILWFNELPIYCEMKRNEIKQVEIGMISTEFFIGGVNVNKPYKYTKKIGKNLWKLPCAFPSRKQIENINNGYTYKRPLLIS